jgi:hypothetical protein
MLIVLNKALVIALAAMGRSLTALVQQKFERIFLFPNAEEDLRGRLLVKK